MYNFGKRVTWTACRDCFDGHLPVKKPPIVSDPQLSPPGAKKRYYSIDYPCLKSYIVYVVVHYP